MAEALGDEESQAGTLSDLAIVAYRHRRYEACEDLSRRCIALLDVSASGSIVAAQIEPIAM